VQFETPVKLPSAQTTRNCRLEEVADGTIINSQTKQRFTHSDPSVDRGGVPVAYQEEARKRPRAPPVSLLADTASAIQLSSHTTADGAEVFRRACELEIEGIVSKRKDERYRSGRTDNWPKATCRHRDTFFVAGWVEKQGKFDGVYLGCNEEGELVYAGKLEASFSEQDKQRLLARLQPLQTKKMPIAAARSFPKARWVEPRVLIDVEFRGKTDDGLLRHPSYQGVREDLMEPPVPRVRCASGRRGRPGFPARGA
jgi:ATP dependent DNA ligase C terminal region